MPKYKCWAPEFHDEDDAIEVDAYEEAYAAQDFAKENDFFETPGDAESGADVFVKEITSNKVTKFRLIGWLQMQYLATEVRDA